MTMAAPSTLSFVLRRWADRRPTRCGTSTAQTPDVSRRLQTGDITRRLDGEYEFLTVPNDPESTEVVYHLAVDLSVPLPGFVKRRAEARIVRTAVSDFTRHVEASG